MRVFAVLLLVLLLTSNIVSAWTIRERYGDDVIFQVSGSPLTNYTINPDMELENLTLSENLYINGNIFKYDPSENFCNAHLGTLDIPLQVMVVESGANDVFAILGGYQPDEKYLVDIGEVEFLTCIANSSGIITFNFILDVQFAYFIITVIRYDVSLDNSVNVIDLSLTWANRDGNAEYCTKYDVNNDDVVNVIDLSLIWINNNL